MHIQEYVCTDMGTPTVLRRTANLLTVCLHVLSLAIIKYTQKGRSTAITIWKDHKINL